MEFRASIAEEDFAALEGACLGKGGFGVSTLPETYNWHERAGNRLHSETLAL